MLIYVCMKNPRNIAKSVKKQPFPLASTPHTLRELVTEAVKTCLSAYKERTEQAKNPTPLTDEQISEMREFGKFAFGVHYNENDVNEEKAIETALLAVEDGLVRIFKENQEIKSLDEPITIQEEDVFTFVRLTMLSGRLW